MGKSGGSIGFRITRFCDGEFIIPEMDASGRCAKLTAAFA
jgi:hypothetical protein